MKFSTSIPVNHHNLLNPPRLTKGQLLAFPIPHNHYHIYAAAAAMPKQKSHKPITINLFSHHTANWEYCLGSITFSNWITKKTVSVCIPLLLFAIPIPNEPVVIFATANTTKPIKVDLALLPTNRLKTLCIQKSHPSNSINKSAS